MGRKSLRPTKNSFVMPEDASLRPRAEKRELTICNLFANRRLTIAQIMNVLDETYDHVLDTLIANKLVHDRRKTPPRFKKGERRLSHFKL
jgi:hypothetical protein